MTQPDHFTFLGEISEEVPLFFFEPRERKTNADWHYKGLSGNAKPKILTILFFLTITAKSCCFYHLNIEADYSFVLVILSPRGLASLLYLLSL